MNSRLCVGSRIRLAGGSRVLSYRQPIGQPGRPNAWRPAPSLFSGDDVFHPDQRRKKTAKRTTTGRRFGREKRGKPQLLHRDKNTHGARDKSSDLRSSFTIVTAEEREECPFSLQLSLEENMACCGKHSDLVDGTRSVGT
ncbi:hypothetical protein GBF38_007430 [Nibea albiflora]|uniref:Uncharacterized protein n=1 Tax=Nibea albiflora TaxID=240163 RepID=A0ACB7EHS4_NIBAL|nr:hypothetical protein GBF38_007430 [Nibea albiflora]